MKIAIFNDDKLGIVKNDKIVDVSKAAKWDVNDTDNSFLYLIENYDILKPQIELKVKLAIHIT